MKNNAQLRFLREEDVKKLADNLYWSMVSCSEIIYWRQ